MIGFDKWSPGVTATIRMTVIHSHQSTGFNDLKENEK